MKEICKYITKSLNLDHETYEVMYYGLFVCATNVASILSVLFIGFLLGEFKNTLYFLIGFIPLRLFVGGYHASTPTKCYWYFNFVLTWFILLFKYVTSTHILMPITMILLFVVFVQVRGANESTAYKVEIMVLLYVVLMFFLKNCVWYHVYLWSIVLNVLLYELKKIK